MAFVTHDQYRQACGVDIGAWLLDHHPEAVTLEYGAVVLRADHHVSVKRGYHGFHNFKTGESGNAVKYLVDYLGYSFPEAVTALCDGTVQETESPQSVVTSEIITKDMSIPAPAATYKNVFAYLETRGIPADVIRMLFDQKLLYQSEKGNNAIFIAPDRDYCEVRGTNSYAERKCARRQKCTQRVLDEYQLCSKASNCENYKKDAFHGCRKARSDAFWYLKPSALPPDRIYICEAAIDAISLYVIHTRIGITGPAVYVSIGGVTNQKTIDRIKHNAKNVIIAVDNDKAGDDCRAKNKDLETIRPVTKDWNEDLQKGLFYGK